MRRASASLRAQDSTRRSAGCCRRRKLRSGAPSARPVLKNLRARVQLRAMHRRGGKSKTPRSYAGRWEWAETRILGRPISAVYPFLVSVTQLKQGVELQIKLDSFV